MDEFIQLVLSNFSLTLLILWLIVSILMAIFCKKNLAEKVLATFFFFNLGLSGLYGGFMHIVYGDMIAEFIGWPQSPFQVEVGVANIAFGITGLLACANNFGFRLATLTNFAVFLWGAAIGHIYQMVTQDNFEPGNAGIIFWTDIFLPILGFILLYVVNSYARKRIFK